MITAMKIRNGFVSNSSSSSFLITESKLDSLRTLKEAIETFLEDYDNGEHGLFWFTHEDDGSVKVELTTETDDKRERLLYEILDSVIY